MILLDANVLLDLWDCDPIWHSWSMNQMRKLSLVEEFTINQIIYAEVSSRFTSVKVLDERLDALSIRLESIPREAAFWAGKAYAHYRRRGGAKSNVLPDFFIGAHASVLGCPILTRDTQRYKTYFPDVRLIAPPPSLS
jgi:hypothetical protein